ncbi:MAG: radical SAM protein [Chloroflexi bacterium]|nr:radical SAM protein [Chloroflexota bacterium]
MTTTLARPLLDRAVKRAAEHLIPLQVSLELTYRCNLSCKHCYVDCRPKGELTLEEVKDIIDQLAVAGTLYLLLTGGEILARKDFFAIAEYAKEKGFIIMLLTNGTLIGPAEARRIAALHPLSVRMSLYGATAATHEAVTGKPGSLDASLQAASLLQDLKVTVSFEMILLDSNIHEAEDARRLAEGMGVPLQMGYELTPTKTGALTPQSCEASLSQFTRFVHPDWLRSTTWGSRGPGICRAGRCICSVSPVGDVSPCLLMPLRLGNLRRASFAEIWRTRPVADLTYLRSLTAQDLTRCRDCSLSSLCRKCLGVALSETGQLTSPSPSACRWAALRYQFLKERR